MHWRKAKRLAEEQRQAELKAKQMQMSQDPPPEKNLIISVPVPQGADSKKESNERVNQIVVKAEEPQGIPKTFPPESRRIHSQMRASIDEQRELEYRQRENQMFKKKLPPPAASPMELECAAPGPADTPGTIKKCMKHQLNKKVIEGKKHESACESPVVKLQCTDRETAVPSAIPKSESPALPIHVAQQTLSSTPTGYSSGFPPRVNLSKQRLLELQSKLMGTKPPAMSVSGEIRIKQDISESVSKTQEDSGRTEHLSAPTEHSVFRDKTNDTPSPSDVSTLKQCIPVPVESRPDPMVILPPSPRRPPTPPCVTSEEEYKRKAKKKLTKIMHQSLGLRQNEPELAASTIYDMLEGYPVGFIRDILLEVFANNPSAYELTGMAGVTLICQRIKQEIEKRTPAN